MRLPGAALALLLLGEQVHGKIQAIYLKKRADVELVTEQFDRRNAQNDASPSATTGSVPSSIPSIAAAFATTFPMPDPEDTKAACMKTLSTLNGVAASESGMSVCYNVDYFDVKTGQFEAHLLLYQVSAASGNFTSLVPKSMSVSLAYPGAIVATGMSSPKTKRSHAMVFDGDIEPQFSVVKRAVAPILVSDMTFVGQATPQTMSQLANETTVMSALEPMVMLSAKTTDGRTVNTMLSSKEAAFVNGWFSSKSIALAAQAAELAKVPKPFVLPGTTLGIFPIGLIITGIWSLLFIAAVGAGTYGRYQFRSSFRRKTQRAGQSGFVGAPGTAAYDRPR